MLQAIGTKSPSRSNTLPEASTNPTTGGFNVVVGGVLSVALVAGIIAISVLAAKGANPEPVSMRGATLNPTATSVVYILTLKVVNPQFAALAAPAGTG